MTIALRVRPARRYGVLFAMALACAIVASCLAYAGLVPHVLAANGVDKVLHFALGATLTFLLDGALSRSDWKLGRRAIPLAPLLVLAPLAVDEILQGLSPCRSSSVADFAADLLGACFAVWLSRRKA